MKEEKKDIIIYYNFGNHDEMWIYSNKEQDNKITYQLITLIDNVPELEEIESPSSITKKIEKEPTIIQEDSIDYMRFMAIKDIVTSDIYKQIKR